MSASPSPFAAEWISTLAVPAPRSQRALDVAMGRGRHALLLAQHGFHTFGVDLNLDAIKDAMQKAARENLQIRGWCADLTVSRLPARAFDVVVDSQAKPILVWRDRRETLPAAAQRLGIGIVSNVTECLDLFATADTQPSDTSMLKRVKRLFGLKEREDA